jgi:hypothetical protein
VPRLGAASAFGLECARRGLAFTIGERHRSPFRDEGAHESAADSAASARDENDAGAHAVASNRARATAPAMRSESTIGR